MWKDEIVEETRKVREAYAAKFNFDLEAICENLKEQEKQSINRIISLPAKEPQLYPQAKVS